MSQLTMMYLRNFLVVAQLTILFGIVMSAVATAEARHWRIVYILCDFCGKSFPNSWAYERLGRIQKLKGTGCYSQATHKVELCYSQATHKEDQGQTPRAEFVVFTEWLDNSGSKLVYERKENQQVLYVVPITSILGRLALVPAGDTSTTPYSMRSKSALYPGL